MPAAEQAVDLYQELAQADPQAYDVRLAATRRLVSQIKVHGAAALFNKAVALGQQEKPVEALAAYDELIRQVAGDQEPVQRQTAAKALLNKGVTLANQKQPGEALAAYDELIRQFAGDQEPVQRQTVAAALLNKGGVLAKRGHQGEALASTTS